MHKKRAGAAWSRHPGSFCDLHVCGGGKTRVFSPETPGKKRLPAVHYDIHYLRRGNANNFKEGAGQNDLLISW